MGLIDNDVVDESNLQRQIIHSTSDVGRLKNDSASERLKGINPEIVLEQFNEALTSKNAMEIITDYDIVADGTDNFQTRYLVNDACVLLGKPNVYGSVYRFEGQASVFWAKKGPCYRCLFPNPPAAGCLPLSKPLPASAPNNGALEARLLNIVNMTNGMATMAPSTPNTTP